MRTRLIPAVNGYNIREKSLELVKQYNTYRNCMLSTQLSRNLQILQRIHNFCPNIKRNRVFTRPFNVEAVKSQLSLHNAFSQHNLKLLTSFSTSITQICLLHSSSYSYTDALCEDISIRIKNNNFTLDSLPIWMNKMSSFLYNDFSFLICCADSSNRKKQILYNCYQKDLNHAFTNNPNFQRLADFVYLNLNNIDRRYCPLLLNLLTILIDDEKPLIKNLYLLCKDNLEVLSVQDIAIFLQSDSSCVHNDFEMKAKVLELFKNQMVQGYITDSQYLKDFCEVFNLIRQIVSKERFEKVVIFIINSIINGDMLARQPIDVLNAICKLPLDSWGDLEEILREKFLELELKLENLDFNLIDLDVDTCLVLGTILDPVLGHPFLYSKRRELFKKFLEDDADDLDPLVLMKLSLLFYSTKFSQTYLSRMFNADYQSQGSNLKDRLSKLVDICDNFWLMKMLKLSNFGKLPVEITQKLHIRLEDLVDSCSKQHLDWILDENQGELIHLLFNICVKKPSLNGVKTCNKLRDFVNRKIHSTIVDPLGYKNISALVVQRIIEVMFQNHAVSSDDMEFGLKVINNMDVQTLMYLTDVLNTALFKGSHSPKVKRNMRHFKYAMEDAFHNKVASVSFLPPVSLQPQQCHFSPVHYNYPALLSSNLVNQLIDSLTVKTSKLEERSCLRAITILHEVSSRHPCFVPETYENLLQFTYTHENIPLHSFLSLMKSISLAGYQPVDAEHFKNYCVQFQNKAIQKKLLRPLEQLQLMYHMSLLENFDNVDLFFSIDTLLTIDKEITNLKIFNPSSAFYFHNCLFQLTRSVVIECPHLSVQQFIKNSNNSKQRNRGLDRLYRSVERIFQDSPFISTATCSPYGHDIDALVCLDWDGFTYKIKDPHCEEHNFSLDQGIVSYRVALIYLDQGHFCQASNDKLTGVTKATIRQLQLLGYSVIEFTEYRLRMMDLHSDESLDDFLKSRIESGVRIEKMFGC